MYYFASRLQAGRMLASRLGQRYSHEPCAVVALSDGGVMVGAQVAMQLHCVLGMLEAVEVPMPPELELHDQNHQQKATIYNHAYSPGKVDEEVSEYYSVLDQDEVNAIVAQHQQLGKDGLVRPELLKGKNIILVSDGLESGTSIDLAWDYLQQISIKKLIVASPMASVEAVARMHVLADDIVCLNVLEDYISTNHYYDSHDIPSHEVVVHMIRQVIDYWQKIRA